MGIMTGRSCIVTGAAQGIGRAIGEALLDEGANVCFADLNGEKADDVAPANEQRASENGGKVASPLVDVSEREQVQAMIAHVVEGFGKLDVKFNNAGVNKPMHFLEVTEENWDFIMRINGLGVLIGTQEAAKQMIDQARVARSSTRPPSQDARASPTWCRTAPPKFAVVSLTQSAARDLAKHDITVTGFAPGVVHTELWDTLDKDLMELGVSKRPGQAMEEFSADILRGRVARPEDITGTTTFLASPGATT